MGKGLGKKQSELLELLKRTDEKYRGVPVVRVSTAIEQTGMYQSAVSRGIKALEERQIVKLITLKTVSKDSIALPVAGSSKQETLTNINQVGKAVKAFTWFDSALKKENWEVLSESFRTKDAHEQVLLAIRRLKQVNFVFEKVYKELKKQNIDVLLDDVDENMSNKFKKHDLIGIPFQIIIGSKSEENKFEFKELNSESEMLSLESIKSKLKR